MWDRVYFAVREKKNGYSQLILHFDSQMSESWSQTDWVSDSGGHEWLYKMSEQFN